MWRWFGLTGFAILLLLGSSGLLALPARAAVVVCSPRPPVRVDVSAAPAGLILVTVRAGGPEVQLTSIDFGTASNALIFVEAEHASPGNFTVALPPGTVQTLISLRQLTAGQAVMVPFVVNDSCGPWPTFAGAGTAVLGDAAPPAAPPVPSALPPAILPTPAGRPAAVSAGAPTGHQTPPVAPSSSSWTPWGWWYRLWERWWPWWSRP